jgi:hypothetical protein
MDTNPQFTADDEKLKQLSTNTGVDMLQLREKYNKIRLDAENGLGSVNANVSRNSSINSKDDDLTKEQVLEAHRRMVFHLFI